MPIVDGRKKNIQLYLKVKMTKLMLLSILMTSSAFAKDKADCLAEIMYSEARGEPVTGAVAVGHATVNRAKLQKRSVCRVKGVTRKAIPKKHRMIYKVLAQAILRGSIPDLTKKSDSWNRGRKPAYRGAIKRVIGKHVFYTMRD